MQKHAYLILAHANPEFLQTLVNCLDNPANDIFIHWDAKSGSLPDLSATASAIRFTSNRVNVHWGDFSVVEAEYALFKEARLNGPYQYYHLISGADLPVKTQDEIHRLCSLSPDTEFIGFATPAEGEIEWRVCHYFLFPHRFQSRNLFVKFLRKAANALQDILKIRRQNGVFKKGSQWASVTESFVDYLLSRENQVRQCFRRTFCPDELYKQTLCWNSGFRNHLPETEDEFEGCRRFIKWEDGCLFPIVREDIPSILSSNRWFARKFAPDDHETINMVLSSIR
jgi:hypothetical protein